MPLPSAIFAISTPFLVSGLQPVRIFSVTGISTRETTAFNIRSTNLVSLSSADPAAFLSTFFAGTAHIDIDAIGT